MLNSDSEKRIFKMTLKRRMIELGISIPFGIGFVFLFWWIGLSFALQLFLTVVCWGAVILIIDLIYLGIVKMLKKKNEGKPKKKDPFAD